jgi:hypothetical protein
MVYKERSMNDKEIIEITENAVRKDVDNTGAFANLLNQEMDALQKAMIEGKAKDLKDLQGKIIRR